MALSLLVIASKYHQVDETREHAAVSSEEQQHRELDIERQKKILTCAAL